MHELAFSITLCAMQFGTSIAPPCSVDRPSTEGTLIEAARLHRIEPFAFCAQLRASVLRLICKLIQQYHSDMHSSILRVSTTESMRVPLPNFAGENCGYHVGRPTSQAIHLSCGKSIRSQSRTSGTCQAARLQDVGDAAHSAPGFRCG